MEGFMKLWIEWFSCVHRLRSSCTRHASFLWMALILAAFALRPDLLGVTSFVRASFLNPTCYRLLLHSFHSNAVVLPLLLQSWVKLAMRLFCPIREGQYVVFAADGLKIPKEGKKMPAVKSLHQGSSNNSKPAYIMGHSFQVISLLVSSKVGQTFSVPLFSRICEGLISKRYLYRKTLMDKLVDMFSEVVRIAQMPALLVADAYYANRKVIGPLLAEGHHLITKARINTVAYEAAPKRKKRKRGRPKKYGRKVHLRDLFKAWQTFHEAKSPVYGETDVFIKYRSVLLLWRPIGKMVQFVLVKHPTRGKMILLSTSLDFDPITVIRLYGLRFKIEVSFKQSIHTIGGYAYHFWMKSMQPIRRKSGDQDLRARPHDYREAVKRKMDAYNRYVQLGCIAQGLLQHLAINFQKTVWNGFRGWLRTMNRDRIPSELVVACALKSSFPEFLLDATTQIERFYRALALHRLLSYKIQILPGIFS